MLGEESGMFHNGNSLPETIKLGRFWNPCENLVGSLEESL